MLTPLQLACQDHREVASRGWLPNSVQIIPADSVVACILQQPVFFYGITIALKMYIIVMFTVHIATCMRMNVNMTL